MSGSEASGRRADTEEEDSRRFAAFVEQLPHMVVVTNRRREIRWVNQAFTKVTGWTLDEVKGRHPRSFLHGPRTSPNAVARLGRLLDAGAAVNDVEMLNYRKSGEPYWVNLSIRPIVDERGEVVEFISVQSDITERKRLEAERLRTEHRLSRALRLARTGWLEHELASGRVVCAPEVLQYFGLVEDSAGGLQISDLTPFTHPDDAERVRAEYARAINSGVEYESEHRVLMPTGEVRWGHVRGVLEGWEDGSPAVLRLVVQDVTERKQAESREREHAADDAARRARTETLAGLEHALREPLQVVLGLTERLVRIEGGRLCARGCAHLQQIRSAGTELLRSVDAIADLVGLRSECAAFDSVPVDLHALAVEVAAACENTGASRGVTVEVAQAAKRAVVIGDAWHLRRLIAHLIEHAIGRSGDGGRILVTVSPAEEGWVRLDVCDAGRGIAAECLHELFEPFFRVPGAGRAEGDTGLRLAICKALVEGMGGTIHVQSEAGAGTRIGALLPAAGATVVPIARAAPAAGGDARRQQPGGCVLCIDEDVVSNALVDGLLERRQHLELSFRRSGAEGLAAARELRPDLILVDLELPDMTGFDFLRRIRADAELRRVPCVALSVEDNDETVVAALRAGFRDVLCKPVGPAELLGLIDSLVRR